MRRSPPTFRDDMLIWDGPGSAATQAFQVGQNMKSYVKSLLWTCMALTEMGTNHTTILCIAVYISIKVKDGKSRSNKTNPESKLWHPKSWKWSQELSLKAGQIWPDHLPLRLTAAGRYCQSWWRPRPSAETIAALRESNPWWNSDPVWPSCQVVESLIYDSC